MRMSSATTTTTMQSTVITDSPPTSVTVPDIGDQEGNDTDRCCDSIGLTLSGSPDQHDNGKDARTMDDDSRVSFIPSSVGPSPIPFEIDGDGDGDGENNNNLTSSIIHHAAKPTNGVSSIMRQQQQAQSSPAEGGSPPYPSRAATETETAQYGCAPPKPVDTEVVAALEDRVRDLEEKLSTLSMLLALQSQSPKQDRSVGFVRQSPPVSGGSVDETSSSASASPPVAFRSLASFSTIPSSNVPVLESPTPVMRGYRGRASFGKPDGAPHSPESAAALNRSTPRINRNLSYRILHAPNSELDLTSAFDSQSGSRSDTGSEESSDRNRSYVKPTVDTACAADADAAAAASTSLRSAADDSFEKACRVPTLDSLPGSSRTSPILSKDPAVNMVISPDAVKDVTSSKNGDAMPSPASFASPGVGGGSRSSMGGSHSATTGNRTGGGKKSNMKSKWLGYLNSVQETNYDTDKQMEEFVRVPGAVESFLSFGFWISVDSFLYTLTMLPLRCVFSTCLLVSWVFQRLTGRVGSRTFTFHRHNSYHLIQASVIYIICKYVLVPIDVSVLYHWIRSQSMVKLYLLVAIVEVFDRLMCSLGQDCLDSLYWNTTRRPRSSRLIVSALVVLVYTGLHSFLLFVHVATLNVAMNSNDQALLSLLIGGNFAEIKSTVFKKYNKATLFKITSSDICERFKLTLFLLLVLTLNASQGMDAAMLHNFLSMSWIVYCAEWLSDWLKHAFITKFNYIASGVYAEYGLLLAGDVSGFGHEGENLDVSHAVVKRLGLAQIPLVCVMTKYLKEAYKYQTYENQPRTWVLAAGFLAVWLVLLATKVVLGSVLERICRNKLEAAPEFSKTNTTVAKKKN